LIQIQQQERLTFFVTDSITNIKNNSNSLPKSRVTIDDDEDDALLQRLMSVEKRGRGGVGSSVMERTFSEDRLVFDGNDVVAADDNRVSISTISTKEKDKKKKKRDKKLKKKLKKEKKKQKLMKKLQKQMEENKSS
jgi:fructose-specific phosphotransferase system component IIB